MIIDEVVLHDFGPYRGRQSIRLTPKSVSKPVILVGGMNGGGKTSLLDGLQLALYGQRASCSSRGSLAYDSFLARSVNRHALASEGASVEVALRHQTVDGNTRLRINRSWRNTGKGIRERLEVWRDGAYDEMLSETWNERVETILPPRLAHLFFFDGERVESLADLSRSQSLLESALNALLGLDKVATLDADLRVIERRKRSELRSDPAETAALRSAERECEDAITRRSELTDRLGGLRTELNQVEKRLAGVRRKLDRQGGELLEKRGALEEEKIRLEAELGAANQSLGHEAAGVAPMLLVEPLLKRVVKQALGEQEAEQTRKFCTTMASRDEALVTWLKKRSDESLQADVAVFLSADRDDRAQDASGPTFLHAPEDATRDARSVSVKGLRAASKGSKSLLGRAEATAEALEKVERLLQTLPPEDRIAGLLEERGALQHHRTTLTTDTERMEEEHGKASRIAERAERKVERMLNAKVRTDFEQEDLGRLIDCSQRTRSTLKRFRKSAAQHHIGRISGLALESLQFLLHKERLVTGLRIDPVTCQVEILGADRSPIPASRLSAGERQLLAISLLWGLARASGRALPTVIDTPLGRLDSKHRKHLVERYFPHASHQVILLSTDEEIDERYYKSIRKWVGRSYLLEHQPEDESTLIREGYFWDN